MVGREPESSIYFAKFVTAIMMIGGLIGAFVVFGDALLGDGHFETMSGWICLGVVAFAYIFRRVYPPFWRYVWGSFK